MPDNQIVITVESSNVRPANTAHDLTHETLRNEIFTCKCGLRDIADRVPRADSSHGVVSKFGVSVLATPRRASLAFLILVICISVAGEMVSGITARRRIASVQDAHLVAQLAVLELIGEPVCEHGTLAETKDAVSILIGCTLPMPATLLNLDELPKAFLKCYVFSNQGVNLRNRFSLEVARATLQPACEPFSIVARGHV